jgi:hypothetical protein
VINNGQICKEQNETKRKKMQIELARWQKLGRDATQRTHTLPSSAPVLGLFLLVFLNPVQRKPRA